MKAENSLEQFRFVGFAKNIINLEKYKWNQSKRNLIETSQILLNDKRSHILLVYSFREFIWEGSDYQALTCRRIRQFSLSLGLRPSSINSRFGHVCMREHMVVSVRHKIQYVIVAIHLFHSQLPTTYDDTISLVYTPTDLNVSPHSNGMWTSNETRMSLPIYLLSFLMISSTQTDNTKDFATEKSNSRIEQVYNSTQTPVHLFVISSWILNRIHLELLCHTLLSSVFVRERSRVKSNYQKIWWRNQSMILEQTKKYPTALLALNNNDSLNVSPHPSIHRNRKQ